MDKPLDAALVWFRRDLRADDHAALHHALKAARAVWCAFVFDTEILDGLPRADRRVEFILASVRELSADLAALGRSQGIEGVRLVVRHAPAADEIVRLARALHAQAVYANHDDEPAAVARDARVRGRLADLGIALHTSKDHVVFERDEVLAASGAPYAVYTPYRAAWLAKLEPYFLKAYAIERHAGALAPVPDGTGGEVPTLEALGFAPTNLRELPIPTGSRGARALLDDFLGRIDAYDVARDYPAVKGPSYLSVHLRFGTLSIRAAARAAVERIEMARAQRRDANGAQAWLSELIWRDFYHQLLQHHPQIAHHALQPAYDRIRWEHGKAADAHFEAWSEGRTGYPLVDAAMAQINQTGWMHNRLRMLTASFLVKDLGIDWRRGERAFAQKLLDYDLAANVGGWQWAASTGSDAQPWFRIFNPVTQSRRFDPEGRFIRRYLPQIARLPDAVLHAPWTANPVELDAAGVLPGRDYPERIVEHEAARKRTLARYALVRDAKAKR
jgi:deoxyribodipyrimidine photo-lyase